jgi:hypothetical protein
MVVIREALNCTISDLGCQKCACIQPPEPNFCPVRICVWSIDTGGSSWSSFKVVWHIRLADRLIIEYGALREAIRLVVAAETKDSGEIALTCAAKGGVYKFCPLFNTRRTELEDDIK